MGLYTLCRRVLILHGLSLLGVLVALSVVATDLREAQERAKAERKSYTA